MSCGRNTHPSVPNFALEGNKEDPCMRILAELRRSLNRALINSFLFLICETKVSIGRTVTPTSQTFFIGFKYLKVQEIYKRVIRAAHVLIDLHTVVTRKADRTFQSLDGFSIPTQIWHDVMDVRGVHCTTTFFDSYLSEAINFVDPSAFLCIIVQHRDYVWRTPGSILPGPTGTK